MRSFLPLALLLLSGCAFVSQKEYEGRLPELDNDGDGSPAQDDCDDGDPARSPLVAEVWYNGIDNDCSGNDRNDYDQDNDGFVPTEYEVAASLPGNDCDDLNPTISPAQAEVFYDGVDQACDGGDDFDQDGDGFRSASHADLDGNLGPDCYDDRADDFNAGTFGPEQINPNAEESWYDGVDENCDGHDDYDQDDDGFVPDEYADQSSLPAGDCNDLDLDYFPGASDDFYDGLDTDCGGETVDQDYDADADGHIPEGTDYTGALPVDDCDDARADVLPGQIERLGDAVDQDCDGGVDTFTLLNLESFEWSSVSKPVFSANSDTVFLSLGAREATIPEGLGPSSGVYREGGLALAWPKATLDSDRLTSPETSGYGALGYTLHAWGIDRSGGGSEFTGAHAFLADDDYLYGVLGRNPSSRSQRILQVVRYSLADSTSGKVIASTSTYTSLFEDVAIALGRVVDGTTVYDDVVFAVGCETTRNSLAYAQVRESDYEPRTPRIRKDFNPTTDAVPAPNCAISYAANTLSIYAAQADGLAGYTIDAVATLPTLTDASMDSTRIVNDLDIEQDLSAGGAFNAPVLADINSLIVVDPFGTAETLTAALEPQNVSVHELSDGRWLVSYTVDRTGSASQRLLIYDPTSDTSTTLSPQVDFTVSDIAVWSEGDTVLFAYIGGSGPEADQVALGAVILGD